MTRFDVEVIYRTDRFSRDGDEVEFLRAGYPDDDFFGVSAIGEGDWESPVVFPGDPGDFHAADPPATDAP
ncbi:MAG: hypothetical protein ACK5QD_02875 [Brevundimonas sp.]|jgi:hypothetical protein|uniref:hypothetical protein n=1 Tax=Brevundimonas sp. TaxID=1871086 RepID=UPI0022C05CCB|nr:hypothetical protein [Brevundimonas sp.]MCZ8193170.1 hypothetical protein [Brevundimonas sp.]